MEKTLLIVKPDGMRDEVIEAVNRKIAENGLTIVKEEVRQITLDEGKNLYAEHEGKSFYQYLVDYMVGDKVKLILLEGDDAISKVRKFIGATLPADADPGTIRAEFKIDPVKHPKTGLIRNTVHASADPEAAKHEINAVFHI